MEEEFRVSKKLLKTLAADTRTKILKALEERPMTASELSRKLNKHVTTISEHLERLKDSELVERVERPGRKWVYYRLSNTGKRILHPKSYYRWVIIFSLVFLCFIGWYALINSYPGSLLYTAKHNLENLQLSMIPDPVARADKHLQYAEERLEEAKLAADRGDLQGVSSSLTEYREEMKKVEIEIERANLMKKNIVPILEKVRESTAKQTIILDDILMKVPKMKEEIQQIMNKTMKTHAAATKQLKSIAK